MKALLNEKALLFLLLSTACGSVAMAQNDTSILQSLARKINLYGASHKFSTLFVHYDKNVYTNNENVWFTGYIVRHTSSMDRHNTLSVALVRDDDRSILAEGKFVMSKGLSFGNIFLPDSLPTGNYTFIAYTNVLRGNEPDDVFVQPVAIKTSKQPAFIATLKITDSLAANKDSIKVTLRAYTKDITLVKEAPVQFQIGDSLHVLMSGRLKTDKFGEAKVSIPIKQITASNNILRTQIKYGNETRNLNLRLPVYKNDPVVNFYPEGGNLITNLPCSVGWEVKDQEGEPLMVNAVLYKDSVEVINIGTDHFGFGKFLFVPQKGAVYSVKLLNRPTNNSYKLPAALTTGATITVSDALATDTLVVQLKNTNNNNKWLLLLHNYRETFLEASVDVMGSRNIKIPLTTVPKGLTTFTLLDENGKAWCERMFFAHYDRKAAMEISTSKQQYKTREKVEVTLKLNNADSLKRGIASVAVVQENRVDVRKTNDIESYAYLKSELGSIPFKTRLLGSEANDKHFLEKLLLIKGWRRYTWVDMIKSNGTDTLPLTSVTTKGTVAFRGKRLDKPVELGAFNNHSINILPTDSSGNFAIPFEQLVLSPDNEIKLFVSNNKQDQYSISVSDPYATINRKLARRMDFQNFDTRATDQNSQVTLIAANERANILVDVKVTTKKDNSIYGVGANACGDWVCQYNILNCINHPIGRPPVAGQMYWQNGMRIVYSGCNSAKDARQYIVGIQGIYTNKEFYVSDYSKFNPPDPEYLSTLYWNYSLLTDEKGEATISFYTSDIAGRFKIIAQGLTNDDAFYGDVTFSVVKE
jgi:hypothetical protein